MNVKTINYVKIPGMTNNIFKPSLIS